MKINVNNIYKKFGDNVVLDNVNVSFESGKIYGLVGRNGSGKSVFLKILCGFYKPNSGNVLFDNYDYIDNNKYPTMLRALVEKPQFFPELSGFTNLKILAEIQKKIGEDQINYALDIVNLKEEKNKKVYKYSLGMKQKLGIAQAIMENPDIIVLDEPFNGIERDSVNKIKNYLLKLKKEDKLIIISTHIKEDIIDLADSIYEFDSGKINEVKIV
ncbi:MAG: ATP-binding cassette domain-containing protein [Bacilli bacterium]|nr:ATP-binding cassette domain-containing protein [Bacilli bacterium]